MSEHLVSIFLDSTEFDAQLAKMTREEIEAVNLESALEITPLATGDRNKIVYGFRLKP